MDSPSMGTAGNASLERYIDRLAVLAESVVDLEQLPRYQNIAEMQNLRALLQSAKARTGIFDRNLFGNFVSKGALFPRNSSARARGSTTANANQSPAQIPLPTFGKTGGSSDDDAAGSQTLASAGNLASGSAELDLKPLQESKEIVDTILGSQAVEVTEEEREITTTVKINLDQVREEQVTRLRQQQLKRQEELDALEKQRLKLGGAAFPGQVLPTNDDNKDTRTPAQVVEDLDAELELAAKAEEREQAESQAQDLPLQRGDIPATTETSTTPGQAGRTHNDAPEEDPNKNQESHVLGVGSEHDESHPTASPTGLQLSELSISPAGHHQVSTTETKTVSRRNGSDDEGQSYTSTTTTVRTTTARLTFSAPGNRPRPLHQLDYSPIPGSRALLDKNNGKVSPPLLGVINNNNHPSGSGDERPLSAGEVSDVIQHEAWTTDPYHTHAEGLQEEANLLALDLQSSLATHHQSLGEGSDDEDAAVQAARLSRTGLGLPGYGMDLTRDGDGDGLSANSSFNASKDVALPNDASRPTSNNAASPVQQNFSDVSEYLEASFKATQDKII